MSSLVLGSVLLCPSCMSCPLASRIFSQAAKANLSVLVGFRVSRDPPHSCNFQINRWYSTPSWRSGRETHYTTLGVTEDASQAEIRQAYIKRSKELHPDCNVGKSQQEKDDIHNKFVKVNEAYSILGNRRERSTYDLEIMMRQDPRWRDTENDDQSTPRNSHHIFRTRPMTFEERLKAAGFKPQDPNFYEKHGNYHKKVALGCVIWIVFGIIVQGVAISGLYNRHKVQLDIVNAEYSSVISQSRNNAKKYATTEEQWNALQLKLHDGRQQSEQEPSTIQVVGNGGGFMTVGATLNQAKPVPSPDL